MTYKYTKKTLAALAVSIGCLAVANVYTQTHHMILPSQHALALNSTFSTPVLSDVSTFNNLPVASVESYPVAQPKGTVILIPQTHLNPASSPSDPINNNAQVAQDQISQIEQFLVTKGKVPMIMVEGETTGVVPQSHLTPLVNEIKSRDEFLTQYTKLKADLAKNNVANADQLLSPIENDLNTVNRDILLKGAAQNIKVKDNNVILVGAENAATLNEAKPLVRDYVYIQDRISSIQAQQNPAATNPNGAAPAVGAQTLQQTTPTSPGSLQTLLATLLPQLMKPSASTSFRFLSQVEQQAPSISEDVTKTQASFNAMHDAYTTAQQPVQSTNQSPTPQPTRADNPYNSITDLSTLQNMLTTSEAKLEKVVVDQRNQEIAQNLAQTLTQFNTKQAILQLGAGHKDGIVQQLNKQNLSVIVVTPTEVAQNPTS